ncbi:hypothetical protein QTO34_004912 [Cnephaeus nilssonii]|uniref:Spermatogenesis- and oogenesis-specific basic helix-loop-helix-containing protein 1 n=1 Tax=Cnephaeus nilssonii TaxID=3371016 RepID=A0AA40LJD4_CNENI|nr:hypothetical protein QTO34_004912 [Eptesicus nilssonii]
MASRGPQPSAGVPRGPIPRACCRKRISLSCERLRALLPRFDGRREDMASVLEMSVQFLRMAGTVLPSGEQQAVLGPTEEDWLKWQLSQTPAEAPGAGTGAPGTVPQDAPSGVTASVDQGRAPTGVAEALDRPAALPGTSGLAPWTPGPSPSQVLRPPPAWPPCSWQPTSPLLSEEAQSCLGQAGPLTEETTQAAMPGTRSVPTCGVEDGPSLLLSASPKWWLGEWGRGRPPSPTWAGCGPRPPDRAGTVGGTEPGFLADPEPSAQETPDGPLEPWGWDVGCPSLAFRDEVDSIFPDFFAS